MSLASILSLASGFTAFSACIPLFGYCFTKTRNFSTRTNSVDVHRIMRYMQKHRGYVASELSVDGEWYPYCVMTLGYCAFLTVRTSEHDIHQQAFEVDVYRPCCLSWAIWEAAIRGLSAATKASDDALVKGEPPLPEKITFLLQTSAHKSWCDFKAEDARAHSRDTDMLELASSMELARMVRAQVDANGGSGVFMIRGPPRTGKNAAGHMFAQLTNAIVCYHFNPTQAGFNLGELMAARDQVDPDRPLLILLDEADIMLKSLGSIPENPTLRTEVRDKSSWNTWMERISGRKNVVVWMTSNDSDEQVLTYDPALLRQDHITAHYSASGGTGSAFVALHERKAVAHTDVPVVDDMVRHDDLKTPLLLQG